jgi:hypothetical protein
MKSRRRFREYSLGAVANPDEQPFHGLARDWRQLLFPTASDDVFADGYAQAVAFALLLARTENIDLEAAGAVIVVRPG